jgi:hypothetical protein
MLIFGCIICGFQFAEYDVAVDASEEFVQAIMLLISKGHGSIDHEFVEVLTQRRTIQAMHFSRAYTQPFVGKEALYWLDQFAVDDMTVTPFGSEQRHRLRM